MSKNDEVILQLKNTIAEKKAKLAKAGKFNPITNCSLIVMGTRYNIHTLDMSTTKELLVILNTYRLSQLDLKLEDVKFQGYTFTDWVTDLKARLDFLSISSETEELKLYEKKLDSLLSEDKRTELELDNIMKALGVSNG